MPEILAEVRKPIPYRPVKWNYSFKERVFNAVAFYNPKLLYYNLDNLQYPNVLYPYARRQPVGMEHCFPSIPGLCSCGCGKPLSGRRRRWSTDDCRLFALWVYFILQGDRKIISRFLNGLQGRYCAQCKRDDRQIYNDDIQHLSYTHYQTKVDYLQVDHIIPVKHGGGSGWLSNFQYLCYRCHTSKTNEDFGFHGSANAISKN